MERSRQLTKRFFCKVKCRQNARWPVTVELALFRLVQQ